MGGRVLRMVAGWLVTIGVVLGVSVWSATPAAAHNSLTGSDPRDGARLAQAPTRIELRFLAKVDPNTTKITVTGPDNVPASRGTPTFDGSRVRVAFVPGAAGLYTVAYQVASSDGHPIKGEVRFTMTTGTPADPTPSPEPTVASPTPPSPSAAPTSPAASPPAADPAAGSTDDSGVPAWAWLIGGVTVLTALGLGLLLRRRRSTTR
ncbi:copper resistance CopC family protein [Micromonospora cathayae]|uniref:Copper resistance protein CopC n=1 Tax=Micromonospora cathayae TaxID=3028804 RepID=A0ABY7ZP22_9ACTN|nr:copper resistance CopC family protein [Micromonospora sp. HUAS 3]WDZ84598.1 copper resistance protein CopC [Micromonospora sp. HUAS 3]